MSPTDLVQAASVMMGVQGHDGLAASQAMYVKAEWKAGRSTFAELEGLTPLEASEALSGGADVTFRVTGETDPGGTRLIVDCQLQNCGAKSANLQGAENELIAIGIAEVVEKGALDSRGYPPLKIFVEDRNASLPTLRTTFAAWYVLQRDLRDSYRTAKDLTRDDALSLGEFTTIRLRECRL
ncbi:hypothetical protein [Brevundimonas sp. M20]|uniref:hypothetical protein n=1 Tax=Brevundimonas sp. M20 TaxID=2591463 RepID=UPI001146E859|nr:hypothetical protein [Brevundimonas sp. M20]QDH72173.1 hypothetical protein FKQ52_01305 [Brevundimonas sp. M20]